jgi:hypothetical protein
MKITKDEARILSQALKEGKYTMLECSTKFNPNTTVTALTKLEERLAVAGKDERRLGRKSFNDFNDCMNRFVTKELDDEGNS